MEKFERLVQKIIERERRYSAAVRDEKEASKADELKGAIIAIRNILVDAAEIRAIKHSTVETGEAHANGIHRVNTD